MTIVIDASLDWSLTTIKVIQGALQLCQAIGVGEKVEDEDAALCLDALNGVIKELPNYGFQWPRISNNPVSISWTLGTPSIVTPPLDYFAAPVLKYTDASGVLRPLRPVSKFIWEAYDLTQTADYPEVFYVSPDLSFHLYPAPTQEPGLWLSYQSILPDVILAGMTNIQQQYVNSLQYFLADEISLKYGVDQTIRAEISARAAQKKFLMLQWATDQAPICISVDDCAYPRSGPLEWR